MHEEMITREERNPELPEGVNPNIMEQTLTSIFRLSVLLLVCAVIPGLGNSRFAIFLSGMQNITTIVAGFAICLILIRMGRQCKLYKTAGMIMLASRLLSYIITVWVPFMIAMLNAGTFLVNALAYTVVSLACSIGVTVLYLVGENKLYHAHADVISGVDPALSEKWKKLFILAVVLAVGESFVLSAIQMYLAENNLSADWIITLLSVVLNIPVIALECVYLNQMIKHFRNIILMN